MDPEGNKIELWQPRRQQQLRASVCSLIAALEVFTVILLVITAVSSSAPCHCLILKHDTPLDSRFVRSFFNTYYLAAIFAASATALSYAFAGRLAFAAGAASLHFWPSSCAGRSFPGWTRFRPRFRSAEQMPSRGFVART